MTLGTVIVRLGTDCKVRDCDCLVGAVIVRLEL